MEVNKRKLLVVVKIRFWDLSAGSDIRITGLLERLAEDHEIEVFFLRRLSSTDLDRLLKIRHIASVRFSLPVPRSPKMVGMSLLRWLSYRPDPSRAASAQPGTVRDWAISHALAGVLRKGNYDAVLFERIWTAKFLNPVTLAVMPAERWLDTHDVIHQRHASSAKAGFPVESPLSAAEEATFFRDFSRLIAIHDEEAEELRRMAPDKEVVTFPVLPKVDTAEHLRPDAFAEGVPNLLHISSTGQIPVRSLRWFLVDVWPVVVANLPAAQLHVLGPICAAFGNESYPNVRFHGFVHNLAPYYRHAALSINPCLAGSGLKIKTVESLAYGLPVVTTSFGAQGIDRNLPLLTICEPGEFPEGVIQALRRFPAAAGSGENPPMPAIP